MDSQDTEHHLKDVKLAMEFKYLAKQAPAGVYLLPELENIRQLHGVIFLRRGLYADGVFRFRIELPPSYNDVNTHPKIVFTPPIFNPFIDMQTGQLDLTVEESLREWIPDKHYIITAITFLKKAFYAKSYEAYARLPNEEARLMFDNDKDLFLKHVTAAVEESQQRVYAVPSASCPLVFTEPKPEHEDLLKKILQSAQTDRDVLTRGMDMDLDGGSMSDSVSKKLRSVDESVTDISTDSEDDFNFPWRQVKVANLSLWEVNIVRNVQIDVESLTPFMTTFLNFVRP